MLASILGLTDLNRDNFGFVKDQSDSYKVKAIDFRIIGEADISFAVSENQVNDLLTGKNSPLLDSWLKNEKISEEGRIEMIRAVFNEEFSGFEKIVEESEAEVMKAIKLIPQEKQPNLSYQMEALRVQVDKYGKDIINNFKLFKEKLAKLK